MLCTAVVGAAIYLMAATYRYRSCKYGCNERSPLKRSAFGLAVCGAMQDRSPLHARLKSSWYSETLCITLFSKIDRINIFTLANFQREPATLSKFRPEAVKDSPKARCNKFELRAHLGLQEKARWRIPGDRNHFTRTVGQCFHHRLQQCRCEKRKKENV